MKTFFQLLFGTIFIVLALLLFVITPVQAENKLPTENQLNYIVGKLLGEGGSDADMLHMVCTVINRIDNGWNYNNVMKQYYGKYRRPSKETLDYVREIFLVSSDCGTEYFFIEIQIIKDRGKLMKPYLFELEGHRYYSLEQFPLK